MTTDPHLPSTIAIPGHLIDLAQHVLINTSGSRVELRPQALDLLCLLGRHVGEVVEKRKLIDTVWPGLVVTDDSLVQAVSDIRRAIGDNQHKVLQTVPRRGYRLIAMATVQLPVPGVDTDTRQGSPDDADSPLPGATDPSSSAPLISPSGTAISPLEDPQKSGGIRQWAVVLLALILVLSGLAAWFHWRPATLGISGITPDRPPIAVLDFSEPSSAVEDQQMARAYAEELTGELARNADLSVIAAQSSFAAGLRGDGLPQVARRLGVGYLVTGSLHREGEHLRLLVQLVDGRDSRVVWTERHDVAAAQVYAVRDALVQRIATSLQSSMRGNQERVALQRPPASMDIYAMTMRGITLKHRFNPKDSADARVLLEKVVALDPQYAPGWLYLGYVNAIDWLNAFSGPRRPEMQRMAIEQLERAVSLDPRLAAGHGALALHLPAAGRHEDAIRSGKRCIDLAPSDAECMMFLASAMVRAGQPAQALALARRAMSLNPLPPSYVQKFFGLTLWANGLIEEALTSMDACVSAAPRYSCRLDRAIARAEAGRLEDAIADLVEWQRNVGPQLLPEMAANGVYGPQANVLMDRNIAALRRLQSQMAAPAATKP